VSDPRTARGAGLATTKDASPPYLVTALVLLGAIAISQAIPWASVSFAGNVPPLMAQLHPAVGPWLPLALIAVAAAYLVLPRALEWPRWAFLGTGIALGWLVAVALASEAHGLSAVATPFRSPLDYWASVPLVRSLGPRTFAEQFPHLAARLALHARTHGPAAVLSLWVLAKIVGGNVLRVSLLVTLVGVAGMAATYAIARELASERAARLAALLFVCAPGVLLYSATSMDAVFMTVIACALIALVRFPRSGAWAVAGGALWALALSFTFGAAALGLLAVGIGIISVRGFGARPGLPSGRVVVRGVLVCAGIVVGATLLWALAGMNLLADFRAASHAHYQDPSRARPYLYWVFANIPAFLIVAGIPQAALAAHRCRLQWRARDFGFETVLAATLALSTLSGVFLGEVDHIWLFFIPPLAVVAGAALERVADDPPPRGRVQGRPGAHVRGVVAAGLGQTLLMQALLYTYW
jgi:4-amino-4-deoxy-L-arabinose transferase-like glycosyltransferase